MPANLQFHISPIALLKTLFNESRQLEIYATSDPNTVKIRPSTQISSDSCEYDFSNMIADNFTCWWQYIIDDKLNGKKTADKNIEAYELKDIDFEVINT